MFLQLRAALVYRRFHALLREDRSCHQGLELGPERALVDVRENASDNFDPNAAHGCNAREEVVFLSLRSCDKLWGIWAHAQQEARKELVRLRHGLLERRHIYFVGELGRASCALGSSLLRVGVEPPAMLQAIWRQPTTC